MRKSSLRVNSSPMSLIRSGSWGLRSASRCRPERLDENAAAVHLRLDETQLTRLGKAAELVRGDRNWIFASADWISAGRE